MSLHWARKARFAVAIGAISLAWGCDSAPKGGKASPKSAASAASQAAPTGAPASAASTAPGSKAPVIPPGTPTPLGEGTDAQIEHFELGKQALDRGDEAGAIKHFEKASEGPVSGPSVSAALAAANLHELRDRPGQARAIFTRMVALAPGVPELRFAAARFFAGQGDRTRAIEGFRATIRHQPEFLPAYPLLAALWTQAGKNEDAAQLLLTYETKLNSQLRRLREGTTHGADKQAIIDLLAIMDDERATTALIQRLEDPDPAVRIAAAGVLGGDDSAEALTALAKAALAETDPIAKRVMIAALKRARDAARRDLGAAPPSEAPPSMPASAAPASAP